MAALRRGRNERPPAQAQEIVGPHEPEHALGVDHEAFVSEPSGDAPIAFVTAPERQSLDQIAQVRVVARRELGFEPTIVVARDSEAIEQRCAIRPASAFVSPCGPSRVIFSMTAKRWARRSRGAWRPMTARLREKNRGPPVGVRPGARARRCAPWPWQDRRAGARREGRHRPTTDRPLHVCAVTRRRFSVGASPTRQPLQPEATGAVMEVTKWLKPSV